MSKPRNLIQSYIDCIGDAKSATVALNEALGTHHAVQRLYEWRAGKRPVPQAVRDWMLRCCLEGVIRHYGGKPPANEQMDRCADALCCAADQSES
ncbi:hypothetical protein [Natronospira bacteriovora]|uniref:Uncharacterized protein n=1 Tax=Natronospira bacteriovora TaxID=3069753 RepID=A0ABU0W5T2_9GAMM|nr:hypothetical protein [Natronospira sp. AB-CW4]MDQ2069299.1 hypothetical protein [Natronospira sp. AB-CW4]